MLNAIHLYRVERWLYRHRVPFLPDVVKLLIFLLFSSTVPYTVEIGPRSFFAYGGIGVVLHKRCRIGSDVIIGQQVTVGGKSGATQPPRIGNHCYLGPKASILGDIEIGDYVIIGANAVVLASVPSYTVVAGVPARVLRTGISVDEYERLL